MSFYNNQLLQTNPALIIDGSQMENTGLSAIGNGITNSLNNLSQYKQTQEDNAYENMLIQHLTDFQHQNQGTENERINPFNTSNGNSIASYLQNPSQYVNGMTANRAGSIWNKFMQERENIANNKQNLLNSNIKNNEIKQYNNIQSYINKVGDTNKDGVIDIRDIGQNGQKVLNGVYGSVINKFINSANQNQDILSKLSLEDKYNQKKQDRIFNHQDKIYDIQNTRELLSSYQTLYNNAYNNYIKLSQYDPTTMTPDMKQRLNASLAQMNEYKNSILNLQNKLISNNNLNNTVETEQQTQNNNNNMNNQNSSILNNIYNKTNNNQYPSVFNKVTNLINNKQQIQQLNKTSTQQMPNQQPTQEISNITTSMLNNPNGTIADNIKIKNNAQNALDDYNTIKKYASKNQYFMFAEPDVSKTYSNFVKPEYAIKQNPALLSNITNNVIKRLNYLQKIKYDSNTGLTPRLYAKMQISKLENALDYAKKHNIKMDSQANTLLKNLQFYATQPISNLQGNNNILSKISNSYNSTEVASGNLVGSLLGDKRRALMKTPHPYNANYTLIDLGKLLLQTNKNYANENFGDKGVHFSTIASDNYSKQIGTNALPQIRTYLAQKLHISPTLLNNNDIIEWLYYQIGDPEANQLDFAGSVGRALGIGGLNNEQASKKGIANLNDFLNSLKTTKK